MAMTEHKLTTVIDLKIARVTIEGISPLSHSRRLFDDFLQGESHSAYEERTWRNKCHHAVRPGPDGKKATDWVTIPQTSLHQGIVNAAKYSKIKIAGARGATWTQKFTSGIAIMEDACTDVPFEDIKPVRLLCDSQGKRGGGNAQVERIFPIIDAGWKSTFDVHILDPIITPEIFLEMMGLCGMFIGLGRWRPQNSGQNGRFRVTKLLWGGEADAYPDLAASVSRTLDRAA